MLYIYAKFSENLITRILGPVTRKFEYSKIGSKVRVSSTRKLDQKSEYRVLDARRWNH